MKKFLLMAAASMMMFTACNNDEDVLDKGTETKTTEISFDFTVNSGIETRGGRPLYSSEALQRVNDLRVYVFKKTGAGSTDADYTYLSTGVTDGTNTGYYKVPAFDNTSNTGTESHTHKITTKLGNGDYKFLAVGFEEGGYDTAFKAFSWTEGTTALNAATLTLNATDADEVFAGVSTNYSVSEASTGIHASIKLERAVAGVLSYFKNIPYQVDVDGVKSIVKSVAVKAVKKGSEVKLLDRTAFGTPAAAYTLMTIDLSGATNNGTIYTCDAVAAGTTPSKVANSWLTGKFVMPIAADGANTTLQVCLCSDAAGATPIKTFDIKCKGDGVDDGDHTSGTIKNFPLLADHFYGIGHKSTDGGNPTEPTDPDEPVDLSKDQEIVITVDATWTTIHDLDIE